VTSSITFPVMLREPWNLGCSERYIIYFDGTSISVPTLYKFQAVMTTQVHDDDDGDDHNASCSDNEQLVPKSIQHIDKQPELNKAGCCGRIDCMLSIVSWPPWSNMRQVATHTHRTTCGLNGAWRGVLPYIIHYSNEGVGGMLPWLKSHGKSGRLPHTPHRFAQ
jgi:hypothetical protein